MRYTSERLLLPEHVLHIRGRRSGRLRENANILANRDRRFRAGSSKITAISIRRHYIASYIVVRGFQLSSQLTYG